MQVRLREENYILSWIGSNRMLVILKVAEMPIGISSWWRSEGTLKYPFNQDDDDLQKGVQYVILCLVLLTIRGMPHIALWGRVLRTQISMWLFIPHPS